MKNIRDIMKTIGCNEANAYRVFEQMCIDGMDFSACTKREFKFAALDAAAKVFGPAVVV